MRRNGSLIPHGARVPQPSCQVAEREAFPCGRALTPDAVQGQGGLVHISQIFFGARDGSLRDLGRRVFAGQGRAV